MAEVKTQQITTLHLWLVTSTSGAWLFNKNPPDKPPFNVWVPRSQVKHILRHAPDPVGTHQRCDVEMEEWLAKEKGLM